MVFILPPARVAHNLNFQQFQNNKAGLSYTLYQTNKEKYVSIAAVALSVFSLFTLSNQFVCHLCCCRCHRCPSCYDATDHDWECLQLLFIWRCSIRRWWPAKLQMMYKIVVFVVLLLCFLAVIWSCQKRLRSSSSTPIRLPILNTVLVASKSSDDATFFWPIPCDLCFVLSWVVLLANMRVLQQGPGGVVKIIV